MTRAIKRISVVLAIFIPAILVIACFVTPWPGVLIVRTIFDSGARATSARLEERVPKEIEALTGLRYDLRDPDAAFDIYRPNGAPASPTIVWIHGGGFVSGQRNDIANYLKILAGQGFTVVNLDYTLAPEARYPMPARQINAALGHLVENAPRLGIDADRMLLAGDSAGAHLAAQVATIVTSADYARAVGIRPAIAPARLKGVILFCGPYDLSLMGGQGLGGLFTQLTVWAYSGARDPSDRPEFSTFSLPPHVTASYPPAFISVGNADPLAPHSKLLAETLAKRGAKVETLFFPDNHVPPLAHEYQFDLDTLAARVALARVTAFARRVGQVESAERNVASPLPAASLSR